MTASSSRRRGPTDCHLDVRLTPELRDLLRDAAEFDGRTVSEFVRRAAELAAKKVVAASTKDPRK
jgi:uncharacterized protein (DUF1778 family)